MKQRYMSSGDETLVRYFFTSSFMLYELRIKHHRNQKQNKLPDNFYDFYFSFFFVYTKNQIEFWRVKI